MNFKISKNALEKAIIIAEKGISDKTLQPMKKGIKFEVKKDKITLYSSNDDVFVRVVIDSDFQVVEEGSFLVDGKLIGDFIKKVGNEELTFILKSLDVLFVQSPKLEYEFNCLNIDDYPPLIFVDQEESVQISPLEFQTAIKKIKFCSSPNNPTPIYRGINLLLKDDKLTFTATDTKRLGKVFFEVGKDLPTKEVTIPTRPLEDIAKHVQDDLLEKLHIRISEKFCLFSFSNVYFQVRLLNGKFPTSDKVDLTNLKSQVKFNKKELIDSLNLSLLFSKTPLHSSNITLREDQVIELLSKSTESGRGKCEISPLEVISGYDLEVGFITRNLLDAVRAFDSNEIVLSYSSDSKPITITSPDKEPNLIHLIVPVRTDY